MATLAEMMALASQNHQSGQLELAAQLYRQILQEAPDHAETLFRLAGVCLNLGWFTEAAANYQKVLRLVPNGAAVHGDLGVALAQLGQLDEAAACLRRAVSLDPQYADAHNNLGLVLAKQGRIDEAVTNYRQSLHLKPDNALAYNNLGNVLRDLDQLDEALACYRQALSLNPYYAEAYNNEGIAYAKQGKFEQAAERFEQALQLRPNYAKAHSNLGNALRNLGRLEASLACYREALRLEPDYAEAHNNLGAAVVSVGQFQNALASYGEAVRLNPEYAEVHRNRALLWLLLGDFERGWPEYEWRWHCQGVALPSFRQPLWDGGPLQARTILLHAEQGLGDTLHFIRYAPLVQQRGGRVFVQCQPLLLSLLARCPGIDQLLPQGAALPDFAVHAPLLSLPGIFRTDLTSIPALVPYLSADPTLVQHWRKELDALSPQQAADAPRRSLNVGIAWQGSPQHPGDRQRSIPLRSFAPLAQVPGVQLFSLQVGPGAEQLRDIGARFPVTDLGSRFDPASFQDAAAAATVLDLVISVDSAIVHLAGALGVPVWVLLPYAPDWRWLLERPDSPWYPTMRLFRQKEPDAWDDVFGRVAGALQKLDFLPANQRMSA
jgi:tetratricopeptide (TPR) repeat protein